MRWETGRRPATALFVPRREKFFTCPPGPPHTHSRHPLLRIVTPKTPSHRLRRTFRRCRHAPDRAHRAAAKRSPKLGDGLGANSNIRNPRIPRTAGLILAPPCFKRLDSASALVVAARRENTATGWPSAGRRQQPPACSAPHAPTVVAMTSVVSPTSDRLTGIVSGFNISSTSCAEGRPSGWFPLGVSSALSPSPRPHHKPS